MYKGIGKKVNRGTGLWSEDKIQKHDTKPGPVKHVPISDYLKENYMTNEQIKKIAAFVSKQINLQKPKTYNIENKILKF